MKTVTLNDFCTVIVRKGKNDMPYIFMQRKRWNKDSFIYLTAEEWEKLGEKSGVIRAMIRRLHQDIDSEELSVSGEEWRLCERRMVRVSRLKDKIYVGIFEHLGKVNYKRGMNMEEEAWLKLEEKRSEIQTFLLNTRPRTKVCSKKLPSSNSGSVNPFPTVPDTSPHVATHSSGHYDIPVYRWKHTSGDETLIYNEATKHFFTISGAENDAKNNPCDFPDRWGYELKMDKSNIQMECHFTPQELCHRVFIVFVWQYIRKQMKANCYGCSVDHPSQIQHMDVGGCLTDMTDTDVKAYLNSAIVSMVMGCHIHRAMEQMKEIIPLTEDMSSHIQDCFAMQESDLENELLKSDTFAVDDIICELFKNQC